MNTTHQLTIRGVDEATKQRLAARAHKQGKSLNAYNLDLLRQAAGTSATKKTNGLERFAGTMEYDEEFEAALRDQRRAVSPDGVDKLLRNLK